MRLIDVAVVQTPCLAEHARLQIDIGNQTAAAAVVHRNRLLRADALHRKKHLEFMRFRVSERNEANGIDRLIVYFVQIWMLLHRFT